jgi:hypothetical protein
MGVDGDPPESGTESLQLRVLGPMQVLRGGTEVDLGRPRGRLILALLVAEIDQVVSTDRLIEGVWGEEPPANDMHFSQPTSRTRRPCGRQNPT